MTIAETEKIQTLCRNFAQEIIDQKRVVNLKLLKQQKSFNGVFVILYLFALPKITKHGNELFEFLGSKIKVPNENEYTVPFRDYVLEHFEINGYK